MGMGGFFHNKYNFRGGGGVVNSPGSCQFLVDVKLALL